MKLDGEKVLKSAVKGLVTAGIGVAFTLLFHNFLVASGDIEWALFAVGFASFFAGFFGDITDEICIGGGEESFEDYIALGGVYTVLGFSFMDGWSPDLSSIGFIVAGVIFFLAAYRKSERGIEDIY